MTDQYLLRLATDLAERAAAAILAIRSKGFDVVSKSDESPVTAADHAAEALIVAGLRQATPAIPVIAEEEVAAGRVTAPSGEYWLVDPLDGTREFAAGRDEFTVNVGLVRDGRAVIGAVAVPALGELFGGIVGHGPVGGHYASHRVAVEADFAEVGFNHAWLNGSDANGGAEEILADAGRCVPMPDNLDYAVASSFFVTYGTSYHALKDRAHLKPGEKRRVCTVPPPCQIICTASSASASAG